MFQCKRRKMTVVYPEVLHKKLLTKNGFLVTAKNQRFLKSFIPQLISEDFFILGTMGTTRTAL